MLDGNCAEPVQSVNNQFSQCSIFMDPPGNFNPFNLSISSTGTITTVYPYDVTLVLSAVVNLGRGLASY